MNSPDEQLKLPAPDQRVFMTGVFTIRGTQVCVVADATDEEILEVCNREDPQLCTGGWHTVVRDGEHARELGVDECAAPGPCANCPGRLHKIVVTL